MSYRRPFYTNARSGISESLGHQSRPGFLHRIDDACQSDTRQPKPTQKADRPEHNEQNYIPEEKGIIEASKGCPCDMVEQLPAY